MRGGLVAAVHNFARNIRIVLGRRAGHERACLHTAPIEQFERAWNALVGSIVEPTVGWQVRKVSFLLDGDRPDRPLLVLRSGFEH
jgi:hypothetical protein